MLERTLLGGDPDAPLVRYIQSLLPGKPWFLGALVCAILLVLVERSFRLWGRPRVIASRIACGVVATVAVYRAYDLSWLSDDAFISFRYARNWASGHGLVYNLGERVEGYTNFLWTAIFALVFRMGLGVERWSIVLSLACLAGSIGLTTRLLDRMRPSGRRPLVSLAGLVLAVNYTFASFGTSGLETMAATFLVLLAVERADSDALVAAGVAGIAATLMHPDHALFYVALGVAVLLGPGERWRHLVRYGAAFLVLFVPYYLARWHYYGDFFPNTYYAKSGGAAYFSQGAVYLWVSGLAAGAVAVLPIACWGAFRYRDHLAGRFTLLAVPLYLAYVAKIGGDFMLGRLLCPALPFVFLMAELAVRRLLVRRWYWLMAAAGVAALALAAVPNGVVKSMEKYLNIADERTFYPLRSFDPIVVETPYTEQAKALTTAFASVPRKPLLAIGCIGVVGWLTDYPIMDVWGLVNRSVAHKPILTRGRPGHEKKATPGHAFEHDVDFSDIPLWPEPYESFAKLDIGGFGFTLAKFDVPVARALQDRRGASVPNLENTLRTFSAKGRDVARLDCDHWFFEQMYFSHDRNGELRAPLVDQWTAERPDLEGLGDLLFGSPAALDPRWRAQTLFSFDDLKEWTVLGDAFSENPVEVELVGQERAAGARGRYANSLHRQTRDAATGRLVSPPFIIHGDAITLRVGGGMQPDGEYVRLLVDGAVVASATGCDSEVLGRRIWPVSVYRGKRAVLEIVDEGVTGWSHILVDEVIEWSHEPQT